MMIPAILSVLAMCANAQTYPDPKITPGLIDPQATVKKLCTPGYTASIRHVSELTKVEVLRRYGIDYAAHRGEYEVDHFISLEIGGKNDILNLWPQRWKPEPGARSKDVVENFLHRQVCAGKMTIAEAQAAIRKDWYAVFRGIHER